MKGKSIFKMTKYVETATKFACIILLFTIVVACFVQVIARYVFSYSFQWVEEMAIWSMVWIMCLGSVLAIIDNAHPRVDFLINKLPRKVKCAVEIFDNLVCASLITLLVYKTIPLIKLNAKNIAPGIRLPISIFYYSLLAGGVLMIIFFFVKMYENAKMINRKEEQL